MIKQYLLTERAHLMCPNMCFGIAATIDAPYDIGRINESITALEMALPIHLRKGSMKTAKFQLKRQRQVMYFRRDTAFWVQVDIIW